MNLRFTVLCAFIIALLAAPHFAQTPAPAKRDGGASARTHYQINFILDFDARTYTATERVRWINRDNRPASVLYFHLYANLRSNNQNGSDTNRTAVVNPSPASGEETATAAMTPATDEPRLEIKSVRHAATQMPLAYALDEPATLLRVNLREPVAAGQATEIEIAFQGVVPEIDPDETSLPAHVMQQLGAALRDTRDTRRARDTNFRARGVMLLGAAYPVLAVRDGDEWQREVRASVGDASYTEVADYNVTIGDDTGKGAAGDLKIFTSGEENGDAETGRNRRRLFRGENLRNFAILAGRNLQSAERKVGGVRVRSVWTAEHEKIGRRVLDGAAEALRIYTAHYGALSASSVTIAEAPLVAGLGSAEFANLCVIASAFYVDFDSPAVRNLPELVREQRTSVEDSLEFAAAHMLAHQWWGMAVGNSPERAPVLDEALAHWSALVYYRATHDAARAAQARDDQLRGVYEIYRTFGGEDMPADRPAREFRNSFQYAAIVSAKGALMFDELQKLLGEERVFTALRRYAEANRFEIAELDDLRGAFIAETPVAERRAVSRLFDRWLSERHGDEDIALPNPQLADALGLTPELNAARDRNAFSRLGRFFWRQMTRIR